MTVALVLTAEADAGLRGQLAALGVGRVDAAGQTGPGLLTIAAAARAARERLLICVGDDTIPEGILARLLGTAGTAAFTGARAPDPGPRLTTRTGNGRRPGPQAAPSWWTRATWTRWPAWPNRWLPPRLLRPRSGRCWASSPGPGCGSGCLTPGRTATARSRGSSTPSPGVWPAGPPRVT